MNTHIQTHTITQTHTHVQTHRAHTFIDQHGRQCAAAHTKTHGQKHTPSGDSPHHCSLMSYSLHLCDIHLSPLTGPGNSIYPSYLYPHPVSPHCVPVLLLRPPPSPALSHSLPYLSIYLFIYYSTQKSVSDVIGSHLDAEPCPEVELWFLVSVCSIPTQSFVFEPPEPQSQSSVVVVVEVSV